MQSDKINALKLLLDKKYLGSMAQSSSFSSHFDQETGLNSKHTWLIPDGKISNSKSYQLDFKETSEILNIDIDLQFE